MSGSLGDRPNRLRAHCPSCGPNKWALVLYCHPEGNYFDLPDGMITVNSYYYTLQCPACERIYFLNKEVVSKNYVDFFQEQALEPSFRLIENDFQYPKPLERRHPTWSTSLFAIEQDLSYHFSSIYVALANNLEVLSAIGMRTTLDIASQIFKIDSNLIFIKKLEELQKLGKIGNEEQKYLQVLTEAGNAAAHRGWRPTIEQLNTMMDILENFIHRNFILPSEVMKLQTTVPQKVK